MHLKFTNFEIIELIEKEYCLVRDEIKIDDQIYKDTSDFTRTNYCSLPQLLYHESDFEEIMKTYLHITLFKKVFTALKSGPILFKTPPKSTSSNNLFKSPN